MTHRFDVRLGEHACARVPVRHTALYAAIDAGLRPTRLASAAPANRRAAPHAFALGAALTLSVLAPFGHAQAATITVDTANAAVAVDGECSLPEAVANANQNIDTSGGDCTAGAAGLDSIVFDGLTVPSTITLGGTLFVAEDLAIVGPDADAGVPFELEITSAGYGSMIAADAPLSVSRLEFAYGAAFAGGAILATSDLTVTDSRFYYNRANLGGAIAGGNKYGEPPPLPEKGTLPPQVWRIENTEFLYNRAAGEGSDVAAGGAVAMVSDGSTFSSTRLDIVDSVFRGNSAPGSKYGGNNQVAKGVYSVGVGGALLAISGASDPAFVSEVAISGTSFVDNEASLGGGMMVFASSVTVDGGDFTGNDASYAGGGAMVVAGKYASRRSSLPNRPILDGIPPAVTGSTTITGTRFEYNVAGVGGGALVYGDTVQVADAAFVSNGARGLEGSPPPPPRGKGVGVDCGIEPTPQADGGGLLGFARTSLGLAGTTSFTGNCAANNGGGAALSSPGQVTVGPDVSFVENQARGSGGGLNVQALQASSVTISGSFDGNDSDGRGGGISAVSQGASDIRLEGVSASNNNAKYGGGGIAFEGRAVAADTTRGSFEVHDSSLSANYAGPDGAGGGVLVEAYGRFYDSNTSTFTVEDVGPHVVIAGSTLSANVSGGNGGGVAIGGTDLGDLSFTGLTLDANASTGSGGGLLVDMASGDAASAESFLLADSTLSNNSAVRGGGAMVGIADITAGFGRFLNSTIHGNSADIANSPAKGSGVTNGDAGGLGLRGPEFRLDFVTVTGNTASGNGGGLISDVETSVALANSIVAGNAASSGPDIFGSVSANFTLVQDASDATLSGANNDIGSDPQLGVLADNGGPTLTRLPLAGSPVIDSGDPAFAPPPANDQRGAGFARVNGIVDKGAVETPASVISIAIAPDPFAEGAASTLTVTLDGTAAQDVFVTVGFTGVAVAGTDFTMADADPVAAGVQVRIPAGSSSGSAPLQALADGSDEPDEAFTATITGAFGASVSGTPSDTATITDGDPTPAISVNDASGAESAGTLAFTVSLSNASSQTVSVSYASANGSAVAPADFTAIAGTLDFAPGVTSLPLPVSLVADGVDEADETFTVALTAPVNGTLADASGTGTITDADTAPTVNLSLSQNPVIEEGGTSNIVATLSAPSQQDVVVTLVFSGTAVFGTDYSVVDADPATPGVQIVIPAGQTSGSVTLTALNDSIAEGNETIIVDIGSVGNATAGAIARATGTIDDSVDAGAALARPVSIPTLSEWMMLLLGLILPATVVARLRRDRRDGVGLD